MTKPTYSELEAENLRVRGLLQRQSCPKVPRRTSDCGTYIDVEGLRHQCCLVSPDCGGEPHQCHCGFQWRWARNKDGDAITTEDLLATIRESSSLVPQGAESADIGKLDAAPCISCRENGMPNFGITCARCGSRAGSAETGGEKAADDLPEDTHPLAARLRKMADNVPPDFNANDDLRDGYYAGVFDAAAELDIALAATFPRSSQNQMVSSGVEGAHEGTTADESELLPTQLPKEK